MEERSYIDEIVERLGYVNDEELKTLVLKLIDEHNYLENNIKIDTLTGAYNRRILKHIRSFNVIAICDVDNFKTINDTYGHNVGDEVLKGVSNILSSNIRINDYLCRFGGDEFLLIFSEGTEEIISKRMNKIKEELEANNLPTISVGLSSYEEGKSLDDVIKEADTALYNSKNLGKNRITSFHLDELESHPKTM